MKKLTRILLLLVAAAAWGMASTAQARQAVPASARDGGYLGSGNFVDPAGALS